MITYQQATLIDAGDELLALVAQAEARGWRWLRSWRTDWAKNSGGWKPHPANGHWMEQAWHEFIVADGRHVPMHAFATELCTDTSLPRWIARGCPITSSKGDIEGTAR